MTFPVYRAKEWQCRHVFADQRCCVLPIGHDGDHVAVGRKNAALKDIDRLIEHVGCGTVDDMGCCVFCDQIRARLRGMAQAEDAVDPSAASTGNPTTRASSSHSET